MIVQLLRIADLTCEIRGKLDINIVGRYHTKNFSGGICDDSNGSN